jgi:S1-C subfamily serine protease
MTLKREVIGVLSILSILTGVGVSLPACAQDPRRTEPSSRPISARGQLTAAEKSVTALFKEATPSVVYITSVALRRDFFRFNVMEIPSGTGTGFVWDDRGNIVTNFHVIQEASRAEVTLADGSNWEAKLVGYAREKDLAVLHIDAPRSRLQSIRLGTSSDLKVGQSVLAIGNPFGFDQTLTTGIVSALGREIESTDGVPIRDVIQTDAAINPGNSGGPLLDSAGRLIGVNTAIVSPSGSYAGVGFAIPVDTVNWVVPQLIAHGRVRRPSMGVELASDHIARRSGIEGAVVTQVAEGSGADRAGIQPVYRDRRGRVRVGDVIVAVNEEKIHSGGELGLILEGFKEGDTVIVTVNREGEEKDLRVTLGAVR